MSDEKSLWQRFVENQIFLSRRFDELILPEKLHHVGYKHFKGRLAPAYFERGQTIYDMGSGSQPYINHKRKSKFHFKVIGLDIDQALLDRAPEGIYDETVCADLMNYTGKGDADLVVCMATLEHIQDNDKAIGAIASTLKPGGKALIYVPTRTALFARINRVLPEGFKKKVLGVFYPGQNDGFPAFYDRCTEKEFEDLADKHGLKVVNKVSYYVSYYMAVFLPLHVLYRMYNLLVYAVSPKHAMESFSIVMERPNT